MFQPPKKNNTESTQSPRIHETGRVEVLALWGDEPEESDFFVPWLSRADVDMDLFWGYGIHKTFTWTPKRMVLQRSFHSSLSKMGMIGVPVHFVGVFESSLSVFGNKSSSRGTESYLRLPKSLSFVSIPLST